MMSLEDEVDQLEKLDRYRVASAKMRDQGRMTLRRHLQRGEDWAPTSDKNDPLVMKALCDKKEGPPRELVSELERLPELAADSADKGPVTMPVLRAARSMQALAAAPDSAFSENFLYSYYQVVREIYTADAPDWKVGGARAAPGGIASAFVTGECVRAISSFSRALDNTSDFVDAIFHVNRRRAQLAASGVSSRWCEMERDRMRRDFCTTVARLLGNIALKLELPATMVTPDLVENFISKIPERLGQAVADTVDKFDAVIKRVKDLRDREERDKKKEEEDGRTAANDGHQVFRPGWQQRRYERSETGHTVALAALELGKAYAQQARDSVTKADADALEELAATFKTVAADVRGLLHPALSYLATVLDRELAAASSEGRSGWDPAEMIFAAVSYGYARSFEDDRLRRAGVCLAEEISDRGRFRAGRPFHVDREGTYASVSGTNVLQAFAQLLENVEAVAVDETLARRLLSFFEDTRRRFRSEPEKGQPRAYGWALEEAPEPASPDIRTTAQSVIALDRINRMLDARINARVFHHFSVKLPEDLDVKIPELRDLMYPDYGLRHCATASAGKNPWQEESIAQALEKMRAHVLGLSGHAGSSSPLFSLILYGPPGTGKTTLVEALARTARVPLVEITPSDIVSSGADVVERRARAVFKALPLLTRVVILFDEFDPVLKRRPRADEEASSHQPTVFSFVTPGMLPKLKHLHDQAERRSVAYVLVTNLISILDGAAIRPGRFDRMLGIYSPDPLSRLGRLLDEALRVQKKDAWPEDFEERILKVVQGTRGAQMQALARRGWLLAPKKEPDPGSPFAYLAGGDFRYDPPRASERPSWEDITKKPMDPESKEGAYREHHQTCWIESWEERVLKARCLADVEQAPAQPKPDESRPEPRA
jgi:hypothetical protein